MLAQRHKGESRPPNQQKVAPPRYLLHVSEKNKNILQMQYGINVKPRIAQQVVAFARSCLGLLRSETSPIYTTIIELMKNTFQHAYDPTTNFSRRWWLIAVHLPESASVSFSFLDNGMGIPFNLLGFQKILNIGGNHDDHQNCN